MSNEIFWKILESHIGTIHKTLKILIEAINYDSFVSWKGLFARNLDLKIIVDEIQEFVDQLDENELQKIGIKQKKYKLPSAYVNAIYGIGEEIKQMNFKQELSTFVTPEESHEEESPVVESLEDEAIASSSETENDESFDEEQVKNDEIVKRKKRLPTERRRMPSDVESIDYFREWHERLKNYTRFYEDLEFVDVESDGFSRLERFKSKNPKNGTGMVWTLRCPVKECSRGLSVSVTFKPYPNFRASNFLKHLELHRKWIQGDKKEDPYQKRARTINLAELLDD